MCLYVDVSYAFVILLKTDEQVEATQTVTLMDTRALRVSKVHFPDHIRFTNLPVNFTVLLEIYALVIYSLYLLFCRICSFECYHFLSVKIHHLGGIFLSKISEF